MFSLLFHTYIHFSFPRTSRPTPTNDSEQIDAGGLWGLCLFGPDPYSRVALSSSTSSDHSITFKTSLFTRRWTLWELCYSSSSTSNTFKPLPMGIFPSFYSFYPSTRIWTSIWRVVTHLDAQGIYQTKSELPQFDFTRHRWGEGWIFAFSGAFWSHTRSDALSEMRVCLRI